MGERRLVTCPETGHLEELELEDTPLGLVVVGCSRFTGTELRCPRECTRRMDRRDRKERDVRDRVLVVVDRLEEDAASVASQLASFLLADGLVVEVASIASHAVPPLQDYDAVVIGGHARFGRISPAVADYVRRNQPELRELPAFLFSVGGRVLLDRLGPARRLTQQTGWRPTAVESFGDAGPLQHSDVRAFARAIADEVPAVH